MAKEKPKTARQLDAEIANARMKWEIKNKAHQQVGECDLELSRLYKYRDNLRTSLDPHDRALVAKIEGKIKEAKARLLAAKEHLRRVS